MKLVCMIIIFLSPITVYFYIRKTPNCVFCNGAFSVALRLSPKTFLVSAGSITPSSHNLKFKPIVVRNVQHNATCKERQ